MAGATDFLSKSFVQLGEFHGGAGAADPVAALDRFFNRGAILNPATVRPAHFPAVYTDIGEQAPAVNTNPPVFQLTPFRADIGSGRCHAPVLP